MRILQKALKNAEESKFFSLEICNFSSVFGRENFILRRNFMDETFGDFLKGSIFFRFIDKLKVKWWKKILLKSRFEPTNPLDVRHDLYSLSGSSSKLSGVGKSDELPIKLKISCWYCIKNWSKTSLVSNRKKHQKSTTKLSEIPDLQNKFFAILEETN